MEARVGVSSHGAVVVDGNARKLLQTQQHLRSVQQPSTVQPQSHIGTVPQLLSGGIAGAFSKTCTAPLSRLTILFQVQGMHSDATSVRNVSMCREALRIVNEEGFRAFWKGNLVTIVHRLPYSSVNFYSYEHYKSFLKSVLCTENHRRNAGTDALVHFVGGGMSGMTSASVTYPLDLVRTRLAAQRNTMYYKGMWHALHTICREEGVLGLYKGLGATLLGVGPSIAISFSVYESLRSYWQSIRPHDSTVVVSLACGSLSGIASSTATFPIDLVRRRKQLEGAGGQARIYNTNLYGHFAHIFRGEGMRGFYRGILPEYYKVVPGVGIAFMTYETLKKLLSTENVAP
ncbi:LOW QUALITY PROTEIN: mitochondrial substrate carrier family protein B-like [Impatiens glandulifera]|uniref:LOW QUALITY PROTEIN: mitochondrial substrate carrier family protein B-like n=1 Tax=Impatiens glandulifera TaxID=253017 RepID=UPI001FB12CCC|nr:LOW QUALITY PROTEIN: mitochondrial substrate carrier family protein B-like [Impatiens glandulifera]